MLSYKYHVKELVEWSLPLWDNFREGMCLCKHERLYDSLLGGILTSVLNTMSKRGKDLLVKEWSPESCISPSNGNTESSENRRYKYFRVSLCTGNVSTILSRPKRTLTRKNVSILSSYRGGTSSTLRIPAYPPVDILQCFSMDSNICHPHLLYLRSPVSLYAMKIDSTISGLYKSLVEGRYCLY
jgi:hypothetical protein